MSTANKLSYLNDTKSLLRSSLNKFGSSILSTDTFRSYDTKLNDIYDKLPKITQSGAGFTLLDVQNGQVDDFKMIGVDLSQSITPTPDNPQEIKVVEGRQTITDKGKNLFDKDNVNVLNAYFTANSPTIASSNSDRTIYIPCSPNTTYTVSKKTVGYGRAIGYTSNIPAIGDTVDGTVNITAGQTSGTITTGANANYLLLRAYNSGQDTNTSFTQIANTIQIEVNSTATDYEPYYEPVSYNIDLQSENLSNGINQNYWLNTAVVTAGVANNNTGLAIDVRNLGIIIIETSVTQTRYRVACVNTLPQTSSQVAVNKEINKDNTSSSITIDTSGYNYLIINATDLSSLNVYYKYELAKIPNTNYKNKIYKNNGNWYFEENVKKYIFNSAKVLAVNDYQSSSTGTSKNGTYSIVVSDMPISLRNDKMMSTEYSYELNSNVTDNYSAQTNMTNNTFCLRQGTNDRIYFKCSDYANKTASEISTAIENESMYYVLANPVTTQITNATLINQLEAISVHTGTNIITISNDNNIIPELEITRLKELEKLA